MMKQFDKVIVARPESKSRPTTKEERAAGKLGSFTTTIPKLVEHKATIGHLGKLYIPVLLPDKKVVRIPYDSLTFTKTGVSYKSKRADWKGIDPKTHKEVLRVGKPITIKGVARLTGLYIPVVIEGKACQIPYEQIKFKKETK